MSTLKSTRYNLEHMELRSKLNALQIKYNKEEDEEKRTSLFAEIEERSRKLDAIVEKYREALEEEERAKEGVTEGVDQETRKYIELRSKVTLPQFLNKAATNSKVDGSAEEYRDHVTPHAKKLDGVWMPLDFLGTARSKIRFDSLAALSGSREERDASIAANAANITVDPVMRRVFPETLAAFLFGEIMSVPAGMKHVPVFATGASLSQGSYAKGASVSIEDTTFTAKVAEPKRQHAIYKWALEDEHTVGGLEQLQRDDLAATLGIRMDRKFFDDLDTQVSHQIDLDGSVADWRTYAGIPAAGVDGLYAMTRMETRLVTPQAIYQHAASRFPASGDQTVAALDYMDRVSGGVRGTLQIANPATSGAQAGRGKGFLGRQRHEGTLIPMWDAVQFIKDDVTSMADGEVILHAIMFMDVVVRRPAKYSEVLLDIA